MKNHIIGIPVIIMCIAGCSNSSNNTADPIEGVWLSQSCEVISTVIGAGTTTNTWGKGTFTFTSDKQLLIGFNSFSDSDCVTQINEEIGTVSNTQISYKSTGAVITQEGIDAFGLSLLPYRDGNNIEFSGFYTITNNILCLSKTFTFGNGGDFTLSGDPAKLAIDFSRCLANP